jgi:hypothetical protein
MDVLSLKILGLISSRIGHSRLKILGLFDLSLKILELVSSRISYSRNGHSRIGCFRNGRSMIGTSICTQQKRSGQLMFSLSVNVACVEARGKKGIFWAWQGAEWG